MREAIIVRLQPDAIANKRKYLDGDRAVDYGVSGKPVSAVVFFEQNERIKASGLPDAVVDELKNQGLPMQETLTYRIGRGIRTVARRAAIKLG